MDSLLDTERSLHDAIERSYVSDDLLATMTRFGLAPERDERVNELLRRTAPLVRRGRMAFLELVQRIETKLASEFYGDDWWDVCVRRSGLQFIRELYDSSVDIDWDSFVSVENVDHLIEQKAEWEGPIDPARVPPGMPKTHWWWWSPGKPPSDESPAAST